MKSYLIWCTDDGDTLCKYIVAPTQEEAELQMYGAIKSEGINGDITDISTSLSSYECDYLDTETGEVLTEKQIYDSYIENYSDREILFTHYLRNCQDKNGFLEYIKGSKKVWHERKKENLKCK